MSVVVFQVSKGA